MLIKLASKSASHTGRTIDISECGARVATRDPLVAGENLQLELYLCETDPFPIRLVGSCRWSRTENHETVSRVEFSPSRPHSLRILRAYVQQNLSA